MNDKFYDTRYDQITEWVEHKAAVKDSCQNTGIRTYISRNDNAGQGGMMSCYSLPMFPGGSTYIMDREDEVCAEKDEWVDQQHDMMRRMPPRPPVGGEKAKKRHDSYHLESLKPRPLKPQRLSRSKSWPPGPTCESLVVYEIPAPSYTSSPFCTKPTFEQSRKTWCESTNFQVGYTPLAEEEHEASSTRECRDDGCDQHGLCYAFTQTFEAVSPAKKWAVPCLFSPPPKPPQRQVRFASQTPRPLPPLPVTVPDAVDTITTTSPLSSLPIHYTTPTSTPSNSTSTYQRPLPSLPRPANHTATPQTHAQARLQARKYQPLPPLPIPCLPPTYETEFPRYIPHPLSIQKCTSHSVAKPTPALIKLPTPPSIPLLSSWQKSFDAHTARAQRLAHISSQSQHLTRKFARDEKIRLRQYERLEQGRKTGAIKTEGRLLRESVWKVYPEMKEEEWERQGGGVEDRECCCVM